MRPGLPPDLAVSPAAERNQQPILGVLRHEFANVERVLEIGSGTGQHAAAFAKALPHLAWQPSDRGPDLSSIEQWKRALECDNVKPAIAVDVSHASEVPGEFDGAFSANTAHIMSEPEVGLTFELLDRSLRSTSVFCLYGPFRENGEFSTESNARFDTSLKRSNPAMGIRDLEQVDEFAARASFKRARRYAMPGNNLLLVYVRGQAGDKP